MALKFHLLGAVMVLLALDTVRAETGEETVETLCGACHTSGFVGAPRIGNIEDWQSRTGKGFDRLVRNAIDGTHRGMPARGGDRSLTDTEVREAVRYMLDQVAFFKPEVESSPETSAVDWVDTRTWKALAADGDHDPAAPGVAIKQQPAEALSQLPADTVGNQVRWVQALREGHIVPRAQLYPSTEVRLLDLDILMPDTAGLPFVLFPHRRHTEWLDCSNCHDELFKEEAGTTPVNMFTVLMGEHCGRCHGAVAFPLTECKRCHSVPQDFRLFRLGREFIRPGLSPYQDSDKVVMARPKSKYQEQGDAKP